MDNHAHTDTNGATSPYHLPQVPEMAQRGRTARGPAPGGDGGTERWVARTPKDPDSDKKDDDTVAAERRMEDEGGPPLPEPAARTERKDVTAGEGARLRGARAELGQALAEISARES